MCTLLVYTSSETIVKQVGIKQARQELPDLIDRAEAGEEIVITRQGKAVAKLIPAPKPVKSLPSLTEFRQGIGRAGTPAVQLLREERDGRWKRLCRYQHPRCLLLCRAAQRSRGKGTATIQDSGHQRAE